MPGGVKPLSATAMTAEFDNIDILSVGSWVRNLAKQWRLKRLIFPYGLRNDLSIFKDVL